MLKIKQAGETGRKITTIPHTFLPALEAGGSQAIEIIILTFYFRMQDVKHIPTGLTKEGAMRLPMGDVRLDVWV